MAQLGYTQGTGAEIKTDQGATTGAHIQVVKLAEGTAGSEYLIPATQANGVLVEVSRVDTPVPVAGTIGATQSGVWNMNIAAVAPIVQVAGSVAVTGTAAVSGAVTANQGTPAAPANAWPVELSDGTHTGHLTSVAGAYALDVNLTQSAPIPGTQTDKTAFVEGSGQADIVGGVYNDAPVGPPGANQAAALRITPQRGLHANLRNQAGTEIGTVAAPLRVDVVGATTQPVSAVLPLPVQVQPFASSSFWTQHVAFTASASAVAIHTPSAGKTSFLLGFILTPTTGGVVKIFDNADSDTSELFNGTAPVASIPILFPIPRPLAAVNNVLRYSTGAAVGDLVVWGYDA